MSNINSEQVNQGRSLLEDAKSILIALSANPSVDTVASGLALYLSLSAAGKSVSISCPTPMTVAYNNLIGVDKISTSLIGRNGRNLVISFPYQEGSIEKVSYNIENNTFNLVIEPRENFPSVTEDVMRYSYSGGSIDAIVTLGASQIDNLESLYSSNQGLFQEKPVINIDYQNQNTKFGKINIVDTSSSCVSEIIISLLSGFGLNLEADIATNLLAGIVDETSNFSSPSTNAATFEAAAICLKNDARKTISNIKTSTELPITKKPFSPPPFSSKPSAVPFGKMTKPPFEKPKIQPQQQGQKQQLQTPSIRESKHPETPPDWLKPKIYKGSTLL